MIKHTAPDLPPMSGEEVSFLSQIGKATILAAGVVLFSQNALCAEVSEGQIKTGLVPLDSFGVEYR